jgi:hypothetical protein
MVCSVRLGPHQTGMMQAVYFASGDPSGSAPWIRLSVFSAQTMTVESQFSVARASWSLWVSMSRIRDVLLDERMVTSKGPSEP